CLACPHPGVNFPDGWKNASQEKKFIAILCSDNVKDPGLHTGKVYFVEHDGYLTHMQKYMTQKDISSCSGFQTLAHAESKNNKGLHVTGIGICVCA
ncbi:uncharacterized protein EV420DRAFT_1264702, partial [Desarmillaria tabescens]